MALTAATLATAVGITDQTEAARLLSVASSLVTKYLRGADDCPDDVVDEATIRVAGYVHNRAGYGAADRVVVGGLSVSVRQPGNPVRQSGAAGILSQWVARDA